MRKTSVPVSGPGGGRKRPAKKSVAAAAGFVSTEGRIVLAFLMLIGASPDMQRFTNAMQK